MALLESLHKSTDIYKELLCIGELIAYIDFQGANKKNFNMYEDTITIAKTYVRQNIWVTN